MQGSITSIEDSLKTANLNIAWNQNHAEKVLEWLGMFSHKKSLKQIFGHKQ